MKRIVLFVCLVTGVYFSNGQSWQLASLPDAGAKWTLYSIDFSSPARGFAVGFDYDDVTFFKGNSKAVILEFENGSWKANDAGQISNNTLLNNVWMLDNDHAWATGYDKANKKGLLLRYEKGTWDNVTLPDPGYKNWILYDVHFLNAGEGYAVGGTFGDGPVVLYFSGGIWTVITSGEFKQQTITTVFPLSKDEILFAGFREGDLSGVMQTTKAYGTFVSSFINGNWEKVKMPTLMGNFICRDISMVGDKFGIMVGYLPEFKGTPESALMADYDGKKWSQAKLPSVAKEWTLSGVEMADEKSGIAVGTLPARNKGLIMEYKKEAWTEVSKKEEPVISTDWRLNDVAYDGQSKWYLCGADNKANKGIILVKTK